MLSSYRKCTQLSLAISTRSIFSSKTCYLDQKWRENNGLPANPNSFGPLTNLPDYHFIDGRPTPLGSNMRKRLQKQKETAGRIVTLCKELKFAKERCVQNETDKARLEEERLDRRLNPKGSLLLKKK